MPRKKKPPPTIDELLDRLRPLIAEANDIAQDARADPESSPETIEFYETLADALASVMLTGKVLSQLATAAQVIRQLQDTEAAVNRFRASAGLPPQPSLLS